jgi:hypothetical protein
MLLEPGCLRILYSSPNVSSTPNRHDAVLIVATFSTGERMPIRRSSAPCWSHLSCLPCVDFSLVIRTLGVNHFRASDNRSAIRPTTLFVPLGHRPLPFAGPIENHVGLARHRTFVAPSHQETLAVRWDVVTPL